METKQDIRNYSDQEFSLLVMNTESLYETMMSAVRRNRFSIIEDELSETFDYTTAQLDDLKEIFRAEVKEFFADC